MTSRFITLVVTIFALIYLAGCSSGMSKEECTLANWNQIGFEDGSYGRNLNYISNHRKSCSKAGITPDFNAYKRGHADGLRQWCNYDNGFHHGEAGRRYLGNCPKDLEAAFLEGFNYGSRLYQARSVVTTIRNDINNSVRRIESLKQERVDLGELILAEETTNVERVKALARIEEIGDDITDIELFIADREVDLQLAENELQNVRP